MSDYNDKQLKKQLQQLPKITDNRSKAVVYRQLSESLQRKQAAGKRMRLIPILAVGFVLIIGFFSIPIFYSFDFFLTTEDSADHKTTEKNEIYDQAIEQETTYSNQPESNFEKNSFVIHDTNASEQIIYAAIADEQLQYTIPISFIIREANNLQAAYNQIDSFIKELEISNERYLLHGVTYELKQKEQKATLKIPMDFFKKEKIVANNLLEQHIMTMFLPYQIRTINFKQGNQEKIDGDLYSKITLTPNPRYSYKLYKQATEKWLVQIPNNHHETIKEAIQKLQVSDEKFGIKRTIPKDSEYELTTSQDTLQIRFSKKLENITKVNLVLLIESVLMTAKSYGYQQVIFQNLTTGNKIENYNLAKPISVPQAPNPVYIDLARR